MTIAAEEVEMAVDPMTMSSAIIGFSGVAITAICKWKKGTNGFMPKSLCDERSHNIAASIAKLEKAQTDGFQKLDYTQEKIFDELKELRK